MDDMPWYVVSIERRNIWHLMQHHYCTRCLRTLNALVLAGLMPVARFDMDGQDPIPRRMMAERADLLGAIRLPNTAFKENAGTEVVADILFFRRKDGSAYEGHDFQHLHATTTVEGHAEVPTNFPGSIDEWLALSEDERQLTADTRTRVWRCRADPRGAFVAERWQSTNAWP